MTTPHSEVQHAHSPYEKDAIRENDERSTSDLHEPFHNLDDPTVLAESTEALVAPLSRNFVVEFGDSHAHVTFDLNPAEFEEYLDSDRPSALSTRWINIWSPFQQTSVLEMLGQRYDFSPRLLALMCAEPRRRLSSTHLSLRTAAAAQGCGLSGAASKQSSSTRSRPNANLVSVGLSNNSRIGNLYDIVDEVWQYSSIDQGRSYLCLGTNSLYPIGHLLPAGGSGDSRNDTEQMNIPIPDVKRVWSWLLLLSDRTVVTITEDLFPYSSGYLSPVQQRILCDTRRSLGNVFRSLSKVEMVGEDRTPLTLLPIRRRLGDTAGETAHRTTDAPGLLFYYLFENWENSYSLITRKESRYNLELQRVRQEMFACPKLAHIDRLDQIGRQLIVLKRHYQSYLRLIDRVIQPQQASMASLVNTRVASKASAESLSSPGLVAVPAHETMNAVASRVSQPREPTIVGDEGILPDMVTAAGTLLGVSLSSAARVRFERLRDSISLYALNETEDCLHQQESLVQMNFQLIAIKESVDVERLTRAAFLISKATVLFLPVSFMTSYFSADFANVNFTIKTYWISFSVVLALSALVLVGFGAVSGTLDSWKHLRVVKPLVTLGRLAKGVGELEDEHSSTLKTKDRKVARRDGYRQHSV